MVNDISDNNDPYVTTLITTTPLVADLINTDQIVLTNIASNSNLEINASSIILTNTSSGTKTSSLSYIHDEAGAILNLGSNTRLNVSVTKLLLNGVSAPNVGSLVAHTSTGLGWTSITDFLQLDTDRVYNVSAVSAMNVSFSPGVTYSSYSKPAILLTPDSDGSGQIIPISLDGYLTDGNADFCGFKVLFGSSKLKYFNYLVLPQTTKLIPGSITGISAPIV